MLATPWTWTSIRNTSYKPRVKCISPKFFLTFSKFIYIHLNYYFNCSSCSSSFNFYWLNKAFIALSYFFFFSSGSGSSSSLKALIYNLFSGTKFFTLLSFSSAFFLYFYMSLSLELSLSLNLLMNSYKSLASGGSSSWYLSSSFIALGSSSFQ